MPIDAVAWVLLNTIIGRGLTLVFLDFTVLIRIFDSFDGCQSFRFIAESAGDAKTWDELQNAYISRTIDSREDHKKYSLQAQSRFSDRPWRCIL